MKISSITARETWPIRHQVLWPDQDFDFVKLPEDAEGRHFGLFLGEKLCTVISLFENKGKVQFRKFATLAEEQGKGYGSHLLQYIIDHELAPGTTVFWCNARVSQQGFYSRFGLLPTAQTYVKAGIDFVVMEMGVG